MDTYRLRRFAYVHNPAHFVFNGIHCVKTLGAFLLLFILFFLFLFDTRVLLWLHFCGFLLQRGRK